MNAPRAVWPAVNQIRTAEAGPEARVRTRNPVVLYGQVQRELKTAAEVAKRLPLEGGHYHANLRIVIGALRRALTAAVEMSEVEEDG